MILDKRIQVFLAIAEAGSFSRAARKLAISQAVVSFHMDALEKELGLTLFSREGRTISLTPEGKTLMRGGRKIERQARRLEHALMNQLEQRSRRINIAGDALTCSFTFPLTMAAFRDEHPDVSFSYRHLDLESIMERLQDGDLDLGLSGYPVQNRKLVIRDCFLDEIVLVSSPNGLPDSITLERLRELPLAWITNDRGLEYTLEKGLSKAGLATRNLNIFMEVEDLSLAKSFLQAGMSLAFLPRLSVANELRHGELKAVGVKGLTLTRTNRIMYRKAGKQREIVEEFIEFVHRRPWQEMMETGSNS